MQLTNQYPTLRNKTIIITGGATGIGAGLVQGFSEQGAHVFFLDIAHIQAKTLVKKTGSKFYFCDLTDLVQLKTTIHDIVQHAFPVHCLINNVANDERHSFTSLTPEYWQQMQDINLRSHVFASQYTVPFMEPGSNIINMNSVSWRRRNFSMNSYTTAKGGLHAFTRTLAKELGLQGIRVNSVVPGGVDTEKQRQLWKIDAFANSLLESQSLKTRIDVDDIVAMCLFLASDDAKACTGQDFIVDAGII